MADFVKNPCGGARWRQLPGGFIEIEGLGVPIVGPGDARFTNIERTWKNFGTELAHAAKLYGLPVSWLLAFANQETGNLSGNAAKQEGAVSPDGGYGLMQIQLGKGGPYPEAPADWLLNAAVSTKLSAQFIREKLVARYGWELPLLGAGYNAGSVRCATGRNTFNLVQTGEYSRNLVLYNNSALQHLDLDPPFKWEEGLVWTLAGLTLVGAGWYAYREKPWQTLRKTN
jgi:hypothetical protein